MKKDCQENVRKFGLLGRNISYSFSRAYFSEKFKREGINATYENFDIPGISEFPKVLESNPSLLGFNVTIPFKQDIMAFLDGIDPTAEKIGAINTVKISKNGKLKGYNTDHVGFSEAIKPFLESHHQKALILGTGGASKAIIYALNDLGILPASVSRSPKAGQLNYEDLNEEILREHLVIVNCTPLGTSPKTEDFPPIPFEFINDQHLVFDLIYNPSETRLMQLAAQKGARVSNGLRMLELQAEKSWEHWNSPA